MWAIPGTHPFMDPEQANFEPSRRTGQWGGRQDGNMELCFEEANLSEFTPIFKVGAEGPCIDCIKKTHTFQLEQESVSGGPQFTGQDSALTAKFTDKIRPLSKAKWELQPCTVALLISERQAADKAGMMATNATRMGAPVTGSPWKACVMKTTFQAWARGRGDSSPDNLRIIYLSSCFCCPIA
ncbi:hypothetical protein ACA910_019343 [Epithemia clementina (nom. ined.)]